ncbi:hypothetical protein C0V75_20345 [Tabrizicola sp. TH137]|uniref:hypothetical protein n=1 Tax=Tabrizicola sp. TH137 TaxID=2067452 RepID=UPI000C7D7600|nr:hypothetical protein [Tabrizicola sp. TH137]PLL10464.1 hypothetical protein C0V75_20345 [Tabrizicola sp. TH137]
MMRASCRVAVVIAFICIANVAAADDLTSLSDVQLIEETREAVVAQDAEAALELLTEMQRRGTGIFAAADRPSCEEVIDLPAGITDWKFRAVARQAYLRVGMSRRLEEGSCACLFDGFSFDAFVTAALGKSTAELTDADRPALERIRDEDRRATEARFRELGQSCRAK